MVDSERLSEPSRQPLPTPDPTILTTDAVNAARDQWRLDLESVREILETRLDGMDKATDLRIEAVYKVPGEMSDQIRHLDELHSERLTRLEQVILSNKELTVNQFKERDVRTEREARDNKLAVDAAFAAQEKQAVAQNEGNNLAISKSETATTETIKTNQELAKSEIGGLRKSHEDSRSRQSEIDDDLKKRIGAVESTFAGLASSARVGAVEAQMVGIAQNRAGAQSTNENARANTALAISGVIMLIGVAALIVSIVLR